MKKTPCAISLFSGAGGLDYGIEAAGIESRVVSDLDSNCCRTLKANRPWPVIQADIQKLSSKQLLDTAGLRAGEVDLLVGGPPCQPFSKSGYWAKGDSSRLKDPRAQTLVEYLRIVEGTLPRVILLENVEGFNYAEKSEGLQFILDGLEQINQRQSTSYKAHVQVLNAAAFGVPQLRHRLILVASREGRDFEFPTATHGDGAERAFRTAWDAIGDVVTSADEDLRVRGKWADMLCSIPEGHNYLWHTDRGGGRPLFGWRRRFWNFLLKLAKDRPSWTIQAQPGPAVGPFHWKNRLLSHRELCRLQTFPDNVNVTGSRSEVQRQIGNAVPSLLAEVLGREIRSQLLDCALEDELKLLPPDRRPCPPPEKVEAVPQKYLDLSGDHSPHPGTGKGYGAEKRKRALIGAQAEFAFA